MACSVLTDQATAQADLEARIAEQAQRIQQHNADIVRLRNSMSGLGETHRQGVATEIGAVQDRIRAAIGKQREALQSIEEHTSRCDVVIAQRSGLPVPPAALANHNRDLAEARFALTEAQKDEQTHRIQLGPLQARVGSVAPAEAEVVEQIVRLTAEVRNYEAALFAMRSQRSQQQLQATIRRSVEELTRPNGPVPAVAVAVAPKLDATVAGSGADAQVVDASARSTAARRRLAELARRAIGEADAGWPDHDLLDAMPKRPISMPAVGPSAPAAAVDVDDFLSRLPARGPTSPLPPPEAVTTPSPSPAPAVEPARPPSGTGLGPEALRPSAPRDSSH